MYNRTNYDYNILLELDKIGLISQAYRHYYDLKTVTPIYSVIGLSNIFDIDSLTTKYDADSLTPQHDIRRLN